MIRNSISISKLLSNKLIGLFSFNLAHRLFDFLQNFTKYLYFKSDIFLFFFIQPINIFWHFFKSWAKYFGVVLIGILHLLHHFCSRNTVFSDLLNELDWFLSSCLHGSSQLLNPECDLFVKWDLVLAFFGKLILRHIFDVDEAELDTWHYKRTYLLNHRFRWLNHVLKGQTRGDVRHVRAENIVQDFYFYLLD